MIFDYQVVDLTYEEWLRRVQRLSRKELLNLCIEQDKIRRKLMEEKTILLQDVSYARRTLGEQWTPNWVKYNENRTRNKTTD